MAPLNGASCWDGRDCLSIGGCLVYAIHKKIIHWSSRSYLEIAGSMDIQFAVCDIVVFTSPPKSIQAGN
jgi:hypothetical protein